MFQIKKVDIVTYLKPSVDIATCKTRLKQETLEVGILFLHQVYRTGQPLSRFSCRYETETQPNMLC